MRIQYGIQQAVARFCELLGGEHDAASHSPQWLGGDWWGGEVAALRLRETGESVAQRNEGFE